MPPALKETIRKQADSLLNEGQRIYASWTKESLQVPSSTTPQFEQRAFITKAMAFIVNIAGENSPFMSMMQPKNQAGYTDVTPWLVSHAIASLKALRDAVADGYLETLEQRLRDNVHGDFLEQADHLLDLGYHVPAMVLMGGVLENHLRQLCVNRQLKWDGQSGINAYNSALYTKAGLYGKSTMTRIQAVGHLRNHAAHGQGDKITLQEVKDERSFITRVMSEYPA